MVAEQRTPTTVAQRVADTLAAAGVDRVFLMTGGDIPLWQALRDAGVGFVLARSESGAAYMADGYARATGRPAVVYGQWGPGAANIAAALADAWWARSPVVALTSSMGLSSRYRSEYQELDQLGMFDAVTKWNAAVPSAGRAADLVAEAMAAAHRAPHRPVHLDLPRDLLTAPADAATADEPRGLATRPSAPDDALHVIVKLLAGSERPVVLAGGGVVASGGWDALARFAETAGVPVVTSMGGKSAVADDHPLSVGVAGRYSRSTSNTLLAQADLCVVVGCDLGGQVTDGYRLPDPSATVVQIDIDAAALGAIRPVDLAVHADARSVLEQLTQRCDPSAAQQHRAWTDDVSARVAAWKERFAERAAARPEQPGTVTPEAVLHHLATRVTARDVVVADAGYMGAWAGALLPVAAPGRTFLRAAGSLGWAFPAVLGAQLARPEGRAIGIVGDGGFGYHLADIETAVRLDIPAITIVLNNACLAYEHHLQEHVFGGDIVPAVNDLGDVDHGAVARALGAQGARATSAAEFADALDTALQTRKPTVIDVVVPRDSRAPVTTYDGMFERAL